MRKLTVKNFSVIKEAELEFGKITVLIGPQSSGKSLLCKLAYFLGSEVIDIAINHVTNQFSFPAFETAVKKEFAKWFPRGGWGTSQFVIVFSSSDYQVTVSAPSQPGQNSEINVKFGATIKHEYIARLAANAEAKFSDAVRASGRLLDSLAQLSFRWMSGRGRADTSVYIPLERSYFVDTKKGYRALASEADPISAGFAPLFADSLSRNFSRDRLVRFLRGNLTSGPEGWLFAFDDGRKLPLSELSSGSKETLPILSVLDMYENELRQPGWDPASSVRVDEKTYSFDDFTIEEPEASVFPETQYELVKEFAALASGTDFVPRFTITTHSPYTLSSFNNLLEAWQVAAAKPDAKNDVAKLIDERYWIKPSDFKAYCIHDGQLESIMDEETGLINGNYLDGVSSEIGSQFDELLRIGYVDA